MAFNSPSPKYPIVYKSTIEQSGRVGPGSYNVSKSNLNSSNNGSQCVFASKLERSKEKQDNKSSSLLGPGIYDIEPAHKKFLVKNKLYGCQTSFDSKIQRFPVPKDKNVREQEEETNVYGFLLQEQSAKRKLGKLFSVMRDRKKISQSIPSIPTAQQSYGYRVDQKTKKLVQNQNPNVLLARKTLTSEIDPKIFSTTNSVYKGPSSCFTKESKKIKGLKWHKENVNSNRSNYKENESSGIQIRKQAKGSKQKNWDEKGNTLVTKESRFNYDKIDKRKQLLINSLKKKYFEFISDEKETEKILRQRIQCPFVQKTNLQQEKTAIQMQCFLSKQNRFPQPKQDFQLMPIENRTMKPQLSNTQKPIKSKFGSNSPRFPNHLKESNPRIGPGSYQLMPEPLKTKHVRTKLEGSRLLEINNSENQKTQL